MSRDYSEEARALIGKYRKGGIVFGKDTAFLLRRTKLSEKEIKNEVFSCKDLSFTGKQEKDGEVRYALFFVYGKRKGRKYVVTFRDGNIRIITVFPLGRKTLRRYRKKGLNMMGALDKHGKI
jgi:hypothetical protein